MLLQGKIFFFFFNLRKFVVAQVEFLQSGPLVDRPAQVQIFDAVLTEIQLSQIAGLPAGRARQGRDLIGPHVYRPQTGQRKSGGSAWISGALRLLQKTAFPSARWLLNSPSER